MSSKVNGKLVNMEKNQSKPANGTRTIYGKDGTPVKEEVIKAIESPVSLELDRSKADEHINKITEYNTWLFINRDPMVDKIEIIGAKVMIRMFKLYKYTKDGMYIGGRTIEVPTESGTRKRIEELPDDFQYQQRGVVVNIGLGCSEHFKNNIKVGDVVDIDPSTAGGKGQRWLHTDTISSKFDNYFLVSEHAIESKING